MATCFQLQQLDLAACTYQPHTEAGRYGQLSIQMVPSCQGECGHTVTRDEEDLETSYSTGDSSPNSASGGVSSLYDSNNAVWESYRNRNIFSCLSHPNQTPSTVYPTSATHTLAASTLLSSLNVSDAGGSGDEHPSEKKNHHPRLPGMAIKSVLTEVFCVVDI